jgi:hypothetical protein
VGYNRPEDMLSMSPTRPSRHHHHHKEEEERNFMVRGRICGLGRPQQFLPLTPTNSRISQGRSSDSVKVKRVWFVDGEGDDKEEGLSNFFLSLDEDDDSV